jgi:hypothetical protein
MSVLDIFAWIVLVVLVVSKLVVVIFLAMLPGMIARKRNHPRVDAVTVGGWVTLFLGFVLWPVVLVWAYVDWPSTGLDAGVGIKCKRRSTCRGLGAARAGRSPPARALPAGAYGKGCGFGKLHLPLRISARGR